MHRKSAAASGTRLGHENHSASWDDVNPTPRPGNFHEILCAGAIPKVDGSRIVAQTREHHRIARRDRTTIPAEMVGGPFLFTGLQIVSMRLLINDVVDQYRMSAMSAMSAVVTLLPSVLPVQQVLDCSGDSC